VTLSLMTFNSNTQHCDTRFWAFECLVLLLCWVSLCWMSRDQLCWRVTVKIFESSFYKFFR
jgi:hypothetical protein